MVSSQSQVAIVGVGATEQGELPGLSANEIAVRAATLALTDAGITTTAIDGLITCKPPPGSESRDGIDEDIGFLLGINPRFASALEYGAGGFSVHLAVMAIGAGLADVVLLTYASNQRSNRTSFARPIGGGGDWTRLAGLVHVAGPAAMAARRHMALYGTTETQIGWISVAQREWATRNPRAIFRTPMSIEDYLAQPYLVAPLRRADLTMISDGGTAVVVARADRVAQFRPPPVYIAGIAQQSALRNDQNPDKLMRPWLATIAARLYEAAGLRPTDVDIAYLQDATSIWVLQQLEAYGFCGLGEAGPFVADGHTRPGGSLPVNTNGGQLSESYLWNWLQLVESVMQLRGECGPRQVPGAHVALHAQTHDFFKGAATLLTSAKP